MHILSTIKGGGAGLGRDVDGDGDVTDGLYVGHGNL
jgi:hypothetical protein